MILGPAAGCDSPRSVLAHMVHSAPSLGTRRFGLCGEAKIMRSAHGSRSRSFSAGYRGPSRSHTRMGLCSGQGAEEKGLLGFAIERSELKNGSSSSAISCAASSDSRIRTKACLQVRRCRLQSIPSSLSSGATTRRSPHDVSLPDSRCTESRNSSNSDDASATTVEITLSRRRVARRRMASRHDVYFNRGVAGSQAYARKFGNQSPTRRSPSRSRWCGCPAGSSRR